MPPTANGTLTRYVLDLNSALTQVLADGSNTYLYGNGPLRVAQYQTAMQYFGADALGSVRQLYNASGQVIANARYDPYGNVLAQSGAASAYGFTGEQTDATGLTFLRARYYDPTYGRFFQQDQWAGDNLRPQSLNSYTYVGNNVVNVNDPTGRCYPPAEWLRNVEGDVCNYMDMALFIYAAPNATEEQKWAAKAYIFAWATAHASFLTGVAFGGVALGGAGVKSAEGVIAWGSRHLLTYPGAAQAIGKGVTAVTAASDAVTVVQAAQGDPQAQHSIALATQMGAPPLVGPINAGRTALGELSEIMGTCRLTQRALDAGASPKMIAAAAQELPAGWRAIFRPRAYGAYRLDKLVEMEIINRTKTAADSDQVRKKLGMGVRILKDGTVVLSDWDLAAVLDARGNLVSRSQVEQLYKGMNQQYGIQLIWHPDNVSGMLERNSGALGVSLTEDWIVIGSNGLEGSVNARVFLNHMEQFWGFQVPRR